MQKLSDAIAAKLADDLGYDKEQQEVLAYGAYAVIQMAVSIILTAIGGILAGCAAEALLISFSASILRKYSGGVHARSQWVCTSIGLIVCIGIGSIIRYSTIDIEALNLFLLSALAAFGWSYFWIARLAPVDTPNKPIRSPKKRMRMKRGSLAVLTFYAVAVLVLAWVGWVSADSMYIRFFLSILFGVLWQTATLTRTGHWLIHQIDRLQDIKRHRKEEYENERMD